MLGGGGGQAEVAVDNDDVVVSPAEADGAVFEGILEPQALLMREHLLRARLPNVNHGFARQMLWGHQFGGRHRSPRGRRM